VELLKARRLRDGGAEDKLEPLQLLDATTVKFVDPAMISDAEFWEDSLDESLPRDLRPRTYYADWKDCVDDAFKGKSEDEIRKMVEEEERKAAEEAKKEAEKAAKKAKSEAQQQAANEMNWTRLNPVAGGVDGTRQAWLGKGNDGAPSYESLLDKFEKKHSTTFSVGMSANDFKAFFLKIVADYFEMYENGETKEIEKKFAWVSGMTARHFSKTKKVVDSMQELWDEIQIKLSKDPSLVFKFEIWHYLVYCLVRLDKTTNLVYLFLQIKDNHSAWYEDLANATAAAKAVEDGMKTLKSAKVKRVLFLARDLLAYYVYGNYIPDDVCFAPEIQSLAKTLEIESTSVDTGVSTSLAGILVRMCQYEHPDTYYNDIVTSLADLKIPSDIALDAATALGKGKDAVALDAVLTTRKNPLSLEKVIELLESKLKLANNVADLDISNIKGLITDLKKKKEATQLRIKVLPAAVKTIGKAYGIRQPFKRGVVLKEVYKVFQVIERALRQRISPEKAAALRREEVAEHEAAAAFARTAVTDRGKKARANSGSDDDSDSDDDQASVGAAWGSARIWPGFRAREYARAYPGVVPVGTWVPDTEPDLRSDLKAICSRVHACMAAAFKGEEGSLQELSPRVYERSEHPNILGATALYLSSSV
jgi:hypothetical protein